MGVVVDGVALVFLWVWMGVVGLWVWLWVCVKGWLWVCVKGVVWVCVNGWLGACRGGCEVKEREDASFGEEGGCWGELGRDWAWPWKGVQGVVRKGVKGVKLRRMRLSGRTTWRVVWPSVGVDVGNGVVWQGVGQGVV